MENGIPPHLRRDVNDRTFNVLRELGWKAGGFHCECGEEGCAERVELLVIEYAARDDQPLLAPGHKRVAAVVP